MVAFAGMGLCTRAGASRQSSRQPIPKKKNDFRCFCRCGRKLRTKVSIDRHATQEINGAQNAATRPSFFSATSII